MVEGLAARSKQGMSAADAEARVLVSDPREIRRERRVLIGLRSMAH